MSGGASSCSHVGHAVPPSCSVVSPPCHHVCFSGLVPSSSEGPAVPPFPVSCSSLQQAFSPRALDEQSGAGSPGSRVAEPVHV